MRLVLLIASLTAVYALALASLHPLDLALGALLSAAVVAVTRGIRDSDEPAGGGLAGRLAGVPALAVRVARETVAGTWQVAHAVIRRDPQERPGIVEVPFGERSPAGVAATAVALTITPGDVIVDIDWDHEVMLVHVLDAGDPGAVRERYRDFYERHQRRVFP